jgi:erythromycin esterase
MNIYKTVITVILLFVFFFTQQSNGQDKSTAIINSLNNIIIPIHTVKPDSNIDDLDFLKQTLENKDIVALGEGTHGTKEFFLCKVRMTQFLVSNLGFKAIAFESDFSTVQKLDDFINNKVKNLDRGYSGFPLNQQTREMLSWLQNYNATKEIQNRVHLYGMEARGFNTICATILGSFSNLSAKNKAVLEKIRDVRYNALDRNDIKVLKNIIPQLYQSDESINSLNRHYVTLLEQTVDHYLDREYGNRDKYMADNVAWMQETTDAKKVIIWAHNGHISRYPIYSVRSLGTYLYQKYNSKYFAIATDFNEGAVHISVPKKSDKVDWINKSFPAVTSKNNYEYYFYQCKYPNFIIDISSLKNHDVLKPFFSEDRFMRSVDAIGELSKTKISILENYDLVVYFNSTNPG